MRGRCYAERHQGEPLRHSDVIKRSVGLKVGDGGLRARQQLHKIREPAMFESKVHMEAHFDFRSETKSEGQSHDRFLDSVKAHISSTHAVEGNGAIVP